MDKAIFHFFNGLLGHNYILDTLFKFIAIYLIYSIPLFLLIYWFFGSKRIALQATLAGVLAWQGFANIIGHFYFRERPFVALPTKEFFFHRPTYSFPSDHATFLFALAFSFWLAGEKKISYWLFGIGVMISVCRIVAGFHYPTDILAGWVLGLFVAWLIWLMRRPINKWIIEPIIFAAKKLRLA